ncbi:hypothetical protein Pfo_009695 [Paulownia fortunei]|nr:hypothetical protein Pfo_009695 [Paulownia fortunei]
MKRQRGNPRKGTTDAKVTKKKAKAGAVKAKEVAEQVVEERKEAEEGIPSAEEMAEWASWWSGVDEEMSWATSWIPFWEMEATGDAYEALYGDVLWDYDIWDLKAIGNAPNP